MLKKAVPFVVAGVLLAGVLLGHLYGGAIAVEMRPNLERWLNQDPFKLQPGPVMKTENLEGMKASEQVKEMVERWKAENIKGPGWVHSVYKTSLGVDNSVVLPNGKRMPRNYISDDWVFLDEEGLVEQAVQQIKDEEGNVLQQAARSKGIEINFTFGMRDEGRQPYPMVWDFGLQNDLSQWEAKGYPVTIQEADHQGKRVKEFRTQGVYSTPVKFGNVPAPVESFIVVAGFDEKTNAMMYTQKTLKLTDGNEIIYSKSEVISVEKTNISEDVIALLEKVQ